MSVFALFVDVVSAVAPAVPPAPDSSDGGSRFWPAVIGGAVGAILSALARALGLPGDVRLHDAGIRGRDESFATWVADRDSGLARESTRLRSVLGAGPGERTEDGTAEGTFAAVAAASYNDSAHKFDVLVADARSAALHEYRDEERLARIDRARILADEGWYHRVWRRLTRNPAAELATPREAALLLDAWRKQSHMSGDRPVWPDDATTRTLRDRLDQIRASGP